MSNFGLGIDVTVDPPVSPTLVVVPVVGPRGAPGAAGGTPTLYPFTTPAATWTVTHNLGRYPVLELLDDTGALFDADVEFPDLNTAVITHAQPTSGSVLIS